MSGWCDRIFNRRDPWAGSRRSDPADTGGRSTGRRVGDREIVVEASRGADSRGNAAQRTGRKNKRARTARLGIVDGHDIKTPRESRRCGIACLFRAAANVYWRIKTIWAGNAVENDQLLNRLEIVERQLRDVTRKRHG